MSTLFLRGLRGEAQAKLEPLDDERYPMEWTKTEDVLREALA